MLTSLRTRYELKCLRCFCTQVKPKNKIYSSTVILPQTKLPLRLENKKLIERDITLSNSTQFKELYAWQRKALAEPEFVLHDGPPYANGSPHIGHVINKVLKDIFVRIKILEGQKVNYIPGWDCHGLPIELKAVTNAKEKLTPLQIREKAKSFAKATIEKQKEAFQLWGVIGDWENAYTTYSNSYIKNQLKQFYNLYKKNLIYRDLKPVYWSPSSKTALAEAELEYNDKHKSIATTITLKIKKAPETLQQYIPSLYAVIWTTTPWTLPSNKAIAYNPELSYSIVKNSNGDLYIVATELIDSLSKLLNTTLETLETFSGKILNSTTYVHPVYENIEGTFLSSSHATATKGTGLVHTAPAHGPDDFLVALNNKIRVDCIVDEDGRYTSDAGPDLKGLFVLTEGNQKVLEMTKGKILHTEDFIHSYPYDWRTKKPVILRASEQWFLNTDRIKERCVELLRDVEIIPKMNSEKHRKNLVGQITKRPYWCISRQRTWGVPIPVLYEKSSGKTLINERIIDHFCNLLEKHGPDFWWSLPKDELIEDRILKELNLSLEDIEQRKDILDIWFDSGLSWSGVLDKEQIANFYLEGIDQCTGWFQSSILTSVALRDKSPYKSLYVHGFVVDENGLKMSKSLGNVIDPLDVIKGAKGKKPYGVDTLRWWVACHGNQDTMTHIGENVLQASADDVQKIRSTLRFSLGALKDYTETSVPYSDIYLLDKYLLHLLWEFNRQASNWYKDYQLNKICVSVINLLTNPVSALYYTAIKDRLYCESVDSSNRISCQYVLYQLFNIVTKNIASIIPHLSEEMYMHLPQKQFSSFFQHAQNYKLGDWENTDLNKLMETVLNIRRGINKELGGGTLSACVHVEASSNFISDLKNCSGSLEKLENELCDLFQVSEVHIIENSNLEEAYSVNIGKSSLHSCNRCRKISSEIQDQLCRRCSIVLKDLRKTEAVLN